MNRPFLWVPFMQRKRVVLIGAAGVQGDAPTLDRKGIRPPYGRELFPFRGLSRQTPWEVGP